MWWILLALRRDIVLCQSIANSFLFASFNKKSSEIHGFVFQNWKEDSSLSTKDLRYEKRLKSLTLLLKCLKIMENATFLSKENQVDMCSLALIKWLFLNWFDFCCLGFCMGDFPSVLHYACFKFWCIHNLVSFLIYQSYSYTFLL